MAQQPRKPPVPMAPSPKEASNGASLDENPMQSAPGVVILRIPGEMPGQEQIQIMEINGMDPLAVPALLGVARKIKNQSLGLEN